jgi:hypothetical protein
MILRINSQQLDRLLDAIKEATPGWLQNLKVIIEMLAVVGAGVWAVFIYLSVQKVTDYLAVEQAKLAVEQSKLTLEQAKQKLDPSIKFIDPKIEIRNLGSVSQNRFSYDVRYSYDFTVNSARTVTVVVAAFEWFVGASAKHDKQPRDGTQSFRANLPRQEGAIIWNSYGIIVHYSDDFYARAAKRLAGMSERNSNVKVVRNVSVLKDLDGGVGDWSPEEVIREFQTIHVVGTPDQWIGFHVSFLMRTGKDPRDLGEYYDDRVVNLAAGSTPREEKPKAP